MRLKWTKYIPHEPTLKQKAFLILNCKEAFYGGAAGGGKSDALLMAALQYVDVKGYVALILRSTYKDLALPGAIMDRAHDWLQGTDAKWNEQTKTWKFPSGARLVFGYLDGPNDHYNYKSAEFHFVGIDEATDLRWNQCLYMFSRLRKAEGSPIPIRFRCASNPGGQSHNEIKEHYIDPETRSPGAIFIPSTLIDNPYVDQEDYIDNLNRLNIVDRKRLKEGDWEVTEKGELFERDWFDIIDPIKVPKIKKKLRWWDLAATDPEKSKTKNKDPDYTVGVKLAFKDGIFYVEDLIRVRITPMRIEHLIKQTAVVDGPRVEIAMEEEPGASGKIVIDHYKRNVLPGFTFRGYPSSGDKEFYAKPLSSYAEGGYIKLVKGHWNKDLLDELVVFPNAKYHDDQVDALSKAFVRMARRRLPMWPK